MAHLDSSLIDVDLPNFNMVIFQFTTRKKWPEGLSKDLKAAETSTVERSYGWKCVVTRGKRSHDGSMVLLYGAPWIPSIYLPMLALIYQHHGDRFFDEQNRYPKWSDFMEIDEPFSSIFWMGSSNDTKTT